MYLAYSTFYEGGSSDTHELLQVVPELQEGEVRELVVDIGPLMPARITGRVLLNGEAVAKGNVQLFGSRPDGRGGRTAGYGQGVASFGAGRARRLILEDAAGELEMLIEIVSNLKIEDATHRTAIIDNISAIFSKVNAARAALKRKIDELASIVHGTTTTTNAMLERKVAKVGVVTTKGFRDVLELGRRTRPRNYGMIGHFEALIDRARLESATAGLFGAHLAVLRQPLRMAAPRAAGGRDRPHLRGEQGQPLRVEGLAERQVDPGVAEPAHLHHGRLEARETQGSHQPGRRTAGMQHQVAVARRLVGRGKGQTQCRCHAFLGRVDVHGGREDPLAGDGHDARLLLQSSCSKRGPRFPGALPGAWVIGVFI